MNTLIRDIVIYGVLVGAILLAIAIATISNIVNSMNSEVVTPTNTHSLDLQPATNNVQQTVDSRDIQ